MALFGSAGGDKELTIVIRARNEALAALKQAEDQVSKFKKTNGEMLKDAAALGGVATAAFAAFGFGALKAAGNMEQTKIAFETMLGSAEKADTFIRDLISFAKTTPFTLQGLETASKQLLAYGFAQEEVLPNLKALGDIAAGVGMDKLPNLILAYGQVRAATRLTGMELRQFTEAGVPMLEELSKIMKKPVAAIQDMVSAGEIGFPVVQQALQNLTGEGGRFNDLMSKQAKSLGGMWSNLEDSWDVFLRGQGAKMLEFAKAFVLGTTQVLNSVSAWTAANPRLTSAIFMVGGAVAALVTAVASLALVLPKVIGFIRIGVTALLRANPVVLALSAAIGLISMKLIEFGDEVGGIGRAWTLTVTQMEIGFWTFVRGVLNGINYVTQFIPGLNTAMDAAITNVTGRIDEANGRFNALVTEGMQNTIKKSSEIATEAPKAFDAISKGAEEAAKKVEAANEAIDDTNRKMRDLQMQYLGDLVDAKQQQAKAFVDEERLIRDLRKQIAAEEDDDKRRELKDDLDKHTTALRAKRDIEKNLSDEIREERRRAGLTDFERELEDINRRVIAKTSEFAQKMLLLQKELAENEKKRNKLIGLETETSDAIIAEVKRREEIVIASIETQITQYKKLANAASGKNSGLSLSSGFGGISNSTPSTLPKRAFGGLVPGPEGMPVPILAHGQERVIPARTAASQGGQGSSYNVVINNPQVRSRADVDYLRTQIEEALRDVSRGHKLAVV